MKWAAAVLEVTKGDPCCGKVPSVAKLLLEAEAGGIEVSVYSGNPAQLSLKKGQAVILEVPDRE